MSYSKPIRNKGFFPPTIATGLAIAASALMASPADAFTLYIDPFFGSTENTGATAKLDFDFEQSGSDVLLNLSIFNTTGDARPKETETDGANAATLVGLAFDLPDIVQSFSYNTLTSNFTRLYENVALQPFGTFDVGIRNSGSGNFIGGNPRTGLKTGESTTVQFRFQGDAATVEQRFVAGFQSKSLTVAARFQEVDGSGSDKVWGGWVEDEKPTTEIPEPSMIGALGFVVAFGAIKGLKKAAVA
jgi:hypothetical protein